MFGKEIIFFLYIAASHMGHSTYTLFFLYINGHTCNTFLKMLPLIFFLLNIENVRECCKAQ